MEPKNNSRQLAACLFADIQGYSSFMQDDEQKALSMLNEFKTTAEAEVGEHNGKIIQFYGDGLLALFQSGLDAVECAQKMQERFLDGGNTPVRIGINSGEVVFTEGNVFGDSINVASRIESLGVPGSVLISKDVRNQLRNQKSLRSVSLGEYTFKNIHEPIEVFAMATDKLIIPLRSQLKGKVTSPPKNRPKRSFVKAPPIVEEAEQDAVPESTPVPRKRSIIREEYIDEPGEINYVEAEERQKFSKQAYGLGLAMVILGVLGAMLGGEAQSWIWLPIAPFGFKLGVEYYALNKLKRGQETEHEFAEKRLFLKKTVANLGMVVIFLFVIANIVGGGASGWILFATIPLLYKLAVGYRKHFKSSRKQRRYARSRSRYLKSRPPAEVDLNEDDDLEELDLRELDRLEQDQDYDEDEFV